jgi:MFS family permease
MFIGKLFRDTYFNTKPLDERDYEKSRNMSIFEGCTARTIFNLTSGAFLAGYASFLGANDSFNGLIGAIPVLAGVVSLFSPMYFEKLEKRKLQIVLLNFLHRFMLGLMVFIPLIVFGKTPRLLLLSVMYLIAWLAVSFSNPAASGLVIDLTPENIRGRYFGRRESYLLAVGTIIALILGGVMDAFRSGGNEYGGFVTTFSVILLLSVANFIFWSSVKEPQVNSKRTAYRLKQVITIPLKNSAFKKIIMFFVIYNIGLQVGGPFFSVYMVTGLKLDYSYIMFMGMIGTIVNVILVRVWGKIADSRSWDFVLKYSILLLGITHFSWFFVTNSSGVILIPILHVISGAAWAGIGISTFNIQFIFSPEEGRTVYIGFNAALGGLMGFLGTLAGSVLLVVFGGMGLHVSSFKIGGMQMLFAISGIILILCAAYAHFVITRQRCPPPL